MKAIFRVIALLALLSTAAPGFAQQGSTFVFVKIIESIMPVDRGNKYEDPLDDALRTANLGGVTGGGSSLTPERKIEWVGVDVELRDIEKGIPFLKQKLVELGAPKGSTLEYQFQGKKIRVPVHDDGR